MRDLLLDIIIIIKPHLLAAGIPHMRTPAQHMSHMNMHWLQVNGKKSTRSKIKYINNDQQFIIGNGLFVVCIINSNQRKNLSFTLHSLQKQQNCSCILSVLRFFLICFVYLCLFIIFRSESWRCRFDSLLFDSYRCHTIDS